MTNLPLVSVIMPVFNAERYLANALNSVFEQTYDRVEILVVDGPSTDGTARLARSFARIRYLRQTGQGMWSALNEGIAAANGELIAFLSADDRWHPDKLRAQVEAFSDHPDIQCSITRVRFFADAEESIPPSFKKELLKGDHVARMPEALMVRKTLFDQIGMFDPAFGIAADVDWFARAKDHRVALRVVDQVLVYKRVHSSNLSLRASSGAQVNRELLLAMKRSLDRAR